jgi:hypothetical protein
MLVTGGYKEDKQKFQEKILKDGLMIEDRIAGVDEVNPYFFRDHLTEVLSVDDDGRLTPKVLTKMRPAWIAEYILKASIFEFSEILDIVLKNNLFSQKDLFKYLFQQENADVSEEIFPYFDDPTILKKIGLGPYPEFSQQALDQLAELPTEEEYRQAETAEAKYHAVLRGIINDPDTIEELLSEELKGVTQEEATKNLLSSYDFDPAEGDADIKLQFLTELAEKLDGEAARFVVDTIGKNQEQLLAMLPYNVGHVLDYMIEMIDDDKFTKKVAETVSVEDFDEVAPFLDQDDLKKLFLKKEADDDERGMIVVVKHFESGLLESFARKFEDIKDPQVQNAILINYLKKVAEPDQNILKKIIKEASLPTTIENKVVLRLKDVGALEEVLLDADNRNIIRLTALERLKQLGAKFADVLETILEDNNELRKLKIDILFEYLKQKDADDSFLKKLVDDPDLAAEALTGITDKDFLRKLILESEEFADLAYTQWAKGDVTDKDWEDFVQDAVINAKDSKFARKMFRQWADDGIDEEGVGFAKKAVARFPKLATWILKNVDREELPEDFKTHLNSIVPRSFDEPESGKRHEVVEDKVPAHKQQLLRLLLTIATPG